jgi:hypothetical protein
MKVLRLLVLSWLVAFAVPAADAPKTFAVSEFTFARPSAWEWVEAPSSMRKAQLRVPGADKANFAEIVFFHFGQGGGGSTRDNVERWLRQFQEPREKINAKTEEKNVNNRKVTYVSAEGTYLSGMPGGAQTPKPNYALAGAIIESTEGNVFVRMTGPKELVNISGAEFRKMIEGALK